MPNVFNRAESWRRRATELRAVADQMGDTAARRSLCAMAGSLDEHARKLEEVLLKVRCASHTVRLAAAAVRDTARRR